MSEPISTVNTPSSPSIVAPVLVSPHNLPAQSTPFVGRTKELRELRQLLVDPAYRLLTIVGPGGIGKTRLALEAASVPSSSFRHGAYFVPLAPLRSAEHIVATMADRLNLQFHRTDEPFVQLRQYLQDKELLLLLDNFEHLMEGVGLLAKILGQAPGVKLLATSRERLNLSGEVVYALGGMAFPVEAVQANVTDYEAMQLLMERARRERPAMSLQQEDLEQAARICRLVQGMPLALVLAAGWLEVLSLREVADEIKQNFDFLETQALDAPERHRSMQAAFEYSWKRLSAREQYTFMKLSVFRGGFTRQAAQVVAGADLSILRTLASKSFIVVNATNRYEVHELLRQYGEAYLEQSGEAEAVRRQHATYYLTHAEEVAAIGSSNEEQDRLARLEAEHENLRAALSWIVEVGEADMGQRLGAALEHFWYLRGYSSEGRGWLEAILKQDEIPRDTKSRMNALASAGYFAMYQYDWEVARERFQESAEIARKLGERQALANALSSLGRVAEWGAGNYEEARDLQQQSVSLYREIGDQRGLATALNMLAGASLGLGDIVGARTFFAESLLVYQELGEESPLPLLGLGAVALHHGDYAAARGFYERSLALSRQLGDKPRTAWSLGLLGNVALCLQEHELAEVLYKESLPLAAEFHAKYMICDCLVGLGVVGHLKGASERAVSLFAASDALRKEAGTPAPAAGTPTMHHYIAELRSQLGDATFSKAWDRGQAMRLEQVVDYAVEG